MFVAVKDNRVALALRDRHGGDLVGENTGLVRRFPAILTAFGKGVLIFAADIIIRCHVVAGFGHGFDAVLRLHLGVHKAPANGGIIDSVVAREGGFRLGHHERRAGHAFDTAGNRQIHVAGLDRTGRDADRIHARGTQTVDRCTGHIDRQAGQQGRHTGHVTIVFAGLVGTAKDHVIDFGPIQIRIAGHQCGNRCRCQIIGADR